MNALLLIDIQNDFLPGGALAVPRGDEVVAVANRLMPHFPLVVATLDWHPAEHGSFAANHPGRRAGEVHTLGGLPQVLWPVHCVGESVGAELAAALVRERIHTLVRKGEDPSIDSYSAFFDNGRRRATALESHLREHGVTHVVVLGLATDYCVRATVLDARSLGFDVTVVVDGVRAVDLTPGDGDRALDAMKSAGARLATSDTIFAALRAVSAS